MRFLMAAACLLAGCVVGPALPQDDEPFLRLQMLALEFDGAPAEQKGAVADRIGIVANRYADLFIAQLRSGDTERKILSAFALGFAGPKRRTLIPILIEAMGDGGPEVRRMAAASVGRLQPDLEPEGARQRVFELFGAMLNDPLPAPREGALYGLSFILAPGRDLGFLPLLHAALADPAALVRNQAAVDLLIVRSPESIEPIVAQLQQEPEPQVRANLCHALGAIGDPAANNGLIDALKDEVSGVVEASDFALRQINRAQLDQKDQILNRSYRSWKEWWRKAQEPKPAESGSR
jgi:HEAT repeat protein